jgi:hypothetical protein
MTGAAIPRYFSSSAPAVNIFQELDRDLSR